MLGETEGLGLIDGLALADPETDGLTLGEGEMLGDTLALPPKRNTMSSTHFPVSA